MAGSTTEGQAEGKTDAPQPKKRATNRSTSAAKKTGVKKTAQKTAQRGVKKASNSVQRRTPAKKPKIKKDGTPVRKPSNAKHNYEEARGIYVEGVPKDPSKPDGDRTWLNMSELSERTGIPYVRIRQRSSEERWPDQRAQFQQKISAKRLELRAESLARETIDFEDKTLDVAKMGTKLVTVRMAEIAREVREYEQKRAAVKVKLDAGVAVEPWELKYLKTAIGAGELERLANAATKFQEIGLKALNADIIRAEISGPNGAPIQSQVEHTISVVQELNRDDPDRLGAFLSAAANAGIFDQLAAIDVDAEEDDEHWEPHPREIEAQQQQRFQQDSAHERADSQPEEESDTEGE